MSLNDPRWGNQGNDDPDKPDNRDNRENRDGREPQDNRETRGQNQGPPDLEDVWRDFNNKLGGIFGGKRGGGPRPVGKSNGGGGGGGGGNGPQLPQFSFRQMGGGLGVLIGILLLVWLGSGFYIVDASQRGVVLRFGQYTQTTEPGLRWRLPAPFESHQIVNLSGVRTIEVGYRGTERNKVLREALMLTDDENITNIQFAVQYVLKNPEDYLFNTREPDESVGQAAETAMRQIVGRSRMDFVLYEGREEIAASAQELMQEILDRYGSGILISRVTMQNAQPPEQVQAAFDDAVKAGQDRERQKNEGEAYANDIIPRARGAAARMVEQATGYRERVVASAEGEASRFTQVLAQYSLAPKVTRERLYLETMQQVLSSTSKVMIDANSNGNLMLLPLDKLMQQSASAPTGPVPNTDSMVTPQPMAPVPAPAGREGVVDPRSRDLMRNRDRELR